MRPDGWESCKVTSIFSKASLTSSSFMLSTAMCAFSSSSEKSASDFDSDSGPGAPIGPRCDFFDQPILSNYQIKQIFREQKKKIESFLENIERKKRKKEEEKNKTKKKLTRLKVKHGNMVNRAACGFIRWMLSRYCRTTVTPESIVTRKMPQVGQGSSLSAEHLEQLEKQYEWRAENMSSSQRSAMITHPISANCNKWSSNLLWFTVIIVLSWLDLLDGNRC